MDNNFKKNLSDAENSFLGVLNDTEYSKNKEFKINKTYMLIKDMQTVIPNNDKELFLVKYKTLMESLNTLFKIANICGIILKVII